MNVTFSRRNVLLHSRRVMLLSEKGKANTHMFRCLRGFYYQMWYYILKLKQNLFVVVFVEALTCIFNVCQ